jgi:hypothetical protein
MATDDELPLLSDYVATHHPRQGRRAAIHQLPPALLEQVTAAAIHPDGPGSVMIHRWLVDECDHDITWGAVDYWVSKQRRLHGLIRL